MGDEDQRDLRAGRRAQGELGDRLGLEARAALGESPTPRVPSFPAAPGGASPAPQPPMRQKGRRRRSAKYGLLRPVAYALPTAKYGLSPRADKYGLNYDDATKDATPKMLQTTPSYVPSTTPEGSPRDPPSSVQLRV